MDRSVALRNLKHIRVDIVRVGANAACSSGQRELEVALSQRLFCQLALGDVAGDPKQLHGAAVRVPNDGTFNGNPALCALLARYKPVLGPTVASLAPQALKGGIQI